MSEYLAQGKTVIIDISATWCGPCWAFHNSHALEDLYETYGPGGSDEIVILFVEGDGATTLADLNGTGNNTQGDWVTGSPYPIIDSAALANLYQISYFPTVYRICPDGIVNEINAGTASQIRNGINTGCGVTMEGIQNYPKTAKNSIRSCTDNATLQTKVRNMGSNNMTSATILLKQDGETIETKAWTGNTSQFSTATINFNPSVVNASSVYTAEVTNINGVAPLHPDQAEGVINVAVAQAGEGTSMTLKVFTDNYPEEIRWRLRDGSNTIIAEGGPYAGQAHMTIEETLTLPDVNDCYRIDLRDSYGDGWGYGETPHGIQVFDGDTMLLEYFTNESFSTLQIPAAFRREAAMSIGENANNLFSIYPNPSNGLFNIRTASPAAITVSDLSGKIVYTGSDLNDQSVLDLTSLQTGMYIAKVKTAAGERIEKLIIK